MTFTSGRRTDLLLRLGYISFLNKLFATYFYPNVTRLYRANDVVFFNYGYEEDPPMSVPLAASDEPNRYSIQLYHRTATQADITGKRVLEVSCGHGGGASYLVRTFHPTSYTGLDLNREGIAFCRRRHNLAGLDFVEGNAENLPFDEESFDAVINVEASSHYPHFPRFLTEVARVLRPGGHFLYTDHRRPNTVAQWDAELADAPMRLVAHADINAEVLRGMDKNTPRNLDLISRLPVLLRRYAREVSGLPGTAYYRAMESGALDYRVYCFAKD